MLQFWDARAALTAEQARERLTEVVCLMRSDGELRGVSSAYQADVPLVGGRRFWIYRNLLDAVVAAHGPELIRATFAALEAEFDRSPAAPIGLCVLIADDPVQRRRRPEAEWSDPRMIYAGYLPDRRQVRIAYFDGADITRRS